MESEKLGQVEQEKEKKEEERGYLQMDMLFWVQGFGPWLIWSVVCSFFQREKGGDTECSRTQTERQCYGTVDEMGNEMFVVPVSLLISLEFVDFLF